MFLHVLVLFFTFSSFATVIEAPSVAIDFQQNPSVLSWKEISTDHFQIIFPSEVEEKAQIVAHLLESAYPIVSRSMEIEPKKISLILQNQSTISNGFVTLAPRRSEWFLNPAIDPEITNTEWLKTLSVHEFRHVVQFQKSRQGFNRVFEIFLGEMGQALGIGLSFPGWFLEGDAVGIETAVTKGGRGRLPLFERDLRALLLEGKEYDYDKAHLGSYEDYIPNHYLYGYFYTSLMRNKYGDLFLSKISNRATERSYNPLTFYNAFLDLTNKSFESFYRESMSELFKSWKEKEHKLKLTPFAVKNSEFNDGWTNYLFPQTTKDHKILALKKGLSFIPQFVLADTQGERTLLYPGPLHHEYPYKLRENKFAFVELELDPRWGYRDYSRIKVFDLDSNKIITDLRKSKGRLAVLNHDGTNLLYVSWDEFQDQHLVICELNGKVLKKLPFSKQRVITSLDWFSDEEVLLVLKDSQDQKSLIKFSLKDSSEQELVANSVTNLGFVTFQEGRILLESPKSGIDNIYEVKEGQLLQLTSSRFGSYAPSLNQNKLIYNDYSAKGMRVVEKSLPWDEIQKSDNSFVPYFEKYAASEAQGEMDKDFFKYKKFPVKKYSQLKHAINLHSWVFVAPPLSSIISFMGISRDVLNKFSLTAGASYDLNEKTSEGFVSSAWSHLYPVFDLKASYGSRNQVLKSGGKEVDDHWEEGTFEGGIQIPWIYINGRFTNSFTLRGFSKLIKVTNKTSSDATEIRDGALFSRGLGASFSFLSKTALRDINTPLGLSLLTQLEEGSDITGNGEDGAILTQDSRLYLPGLLKHHSFFHQFAYERQRDSNYQYKSYLLKPRGTKNVFLDEAFKYSGNYLFPLAYPDWHWSKYVYLKRLSMNLFYDQIDGKFSSTSYFSNTTGWELLFETHLLRIFIPVTLGLRGNYVLNGEESNNYEIFITTIGTNF
jgi:hypothetical protein